MSMCLYKRTTYKRERGHLCVYVYTLYTNTHQRTRLEYEKFLVRFEENPFVPLCPRSKYFI